MQRSVSTLCVRAAVQEMAGPDDGSAEAGCRRHPKVDHSLMPPEEPPRRQLSACVFCALLDWPEELRFVYLAGEQCFMPSPGLVADLLSVEWYKSQWPLIPPEELDASAVDLPHSSVTGQLTCSKVLMHRRRVTAAMLRGEERALVCAGCYEAGGRRNHVLSKTALSNSLWLDQQGHE